MTVFFMTVVDFYRRHIDNCKSQRLLDWKPLDFVEVRQAMSKMTSKLTQRNPLEFANYQVT